MPLLRWICTRRYIDAILLLTLHVAPLALAKAAPRSISDTGNSTRCIRGPA